MILQEHAQLVGRTLVNFISMQTRETWHLVEVVDRQSPSGERWTAAVRSVYLFLTEKAATVVFHPARGERQICRVSGHATRFVVTDANGEIDFELTKRVGFMTDKAIATGQVESGIRLEELPSKPAQLRQTHTVEGQWYALGDQFVHLKHDWRQMRLADLIVLYGQVGDRYQPIEMSDDQIAQVVAMIEELRQQEKALGA